MTTPLFPPRKISTDPTSPHFSAWWNARIKDVLLDGEIVRMVFAYDMDEGWVDLLAQPPRRGPNGKALRERRHGVVGVTTREASPKESS